MFCPPYKKECVNEKETTRKEKMMMFNKEYSAIFNKEHRNYMFAGLFLTWIVLALMA